ncbi:MAG: hypothetical protein AAGK97_03960 [Bacteroidota bacterium]
MKYEDYYKQPEVKVLESNESTPNIIPWFFNLFGFMAIQAGAIFLLGKLLNEVLRGLLVLAFFIIVFISLIRIRWTSKLFLIAPQPVFFDNDYTLVKFPHFIKKLVIKDLESILFILQNDVVKQNHSKESLRKYEPGNLYHNQNVMDQIRINKTEFFIEILNKEDQINFLKFANQMHHFNKKTRLIVDRDEIKLPVDINTRF